jgi:hypothetical protein
LGQTTQAFFLACLLFNRGCTIQPLKIIRIMSTIPPSSDTYVPATPPPTRPGAMDAYQKPSLQNGKHVPYKPPAHGCVGVLKDSRNLTN